MIRRAFTMKLKPGALAEYREHHDTLPEKWPRLLDEIRESGIAQITTFQSGLDLFLYSEIHDEQAWDKLWQSDIHRQWTELMQPLLHLDENGFVQTGELTEIFHCEPGRSSS